METVEGDNCPLKGLLAKEYALPWLGKQRLRRLIDLMSNRWASHARARARDVFDSVTSAGGRRQWLWVQAST